MLNTPLSPSLYIEWEGLPVWDSSQHLIALRKIPILGRIPPKLVGNFHFYYSISGALKSSTTISVYGDQHRVASTQKAHSNFAQKRVWVGFPIPDALFFPLEALCSFFCVSDNGTKVWRRPLRPAIFIFLLFSGKRTSPSHLFFEEKQKK